MVDYVDGLVSIIIPIRKGENISKLIASIYGSTYSMVEVIIVDEGKERSEQRNIGINRTKGEFLLFADSDWILTKWLIRECVDLMILCDSIYIPEEIITKGWFAKLRNWERQFYTGTAIDCVRFVRAKDCPRFNEELNGPEDADFDRRIKGKRAISRNVYHHKDGVGLLTYFKKKAYYSKSMKLYEQLHPGDRVLNPIYRCFWVFLENGKWKRFFRNPVMAIGVILIVFIRGIIYLRR